MSVAHFGIVPRPMPVQGPPIRKIDDPVAGMQLAVSPATIDSMPVMEPPTRQIDDPSPAVEVALGSSDGYTVQAGDSLTSIVVKLGLVLPPFNNSEAAWAPAIAAANALAKYNGITDPNSISPGDVLSLPPTSPEEQLPLGKEIDQTGGLVQGATALPSDATGGYLMVGGLVVAGLALYLLSKEK